MMDHRIGAQLYTVRDFTQTAEGLEETFQKLKNIGYQTVQLSAIGPMEGAVVRDLCDRYQLEPVCTHKSPQDYLENLDATIAYHKTVGCQIAGLGAMPWDVPRTARGMRDFIRDFTPVSRALREAGLCFAYHNHAFEFIRDEGKFLMDILLEESDFDLILDVYWLSFAGIDPADFIRRAGSRARIIHFKDLAVNQENKVEMAEVMEGNLDWDKIIQACEQAGCQAAMAEQDICKGDPFESLRISYDNLKAKGFC